MIRYCLPFFCFFFISSYAIVPDLDKKRVPLDHHMEHPDHVPHHGGKDPIKKMTQDEIVFPRKRKKGNMLVSV